MKIFIGLYLLSNQSINTAIFKPNECIREYELTYTEYIVNDCLSTSHLQPQFTLDPGAYI